MVNAIYDRYKLISFWYTEAVYYNQTGRSPVVPLFYEWPEIESLHKNANDVLLGGAILVCPVVHQGATVRLVEKPPGNWYEFRTGRPFKETAAVVVTMDDIPLYIRAGRIVPYYRMAQNNTKDTIRTPMTLIIAADDDGMAVGIVYLDDGVTYNYTLGEYVHRKFSYDRRIRSVIWEKADLNEKRVPEFLKKAIVTEFVIYDSNGVKRVTGLNLSVCEEWWWQQGEGVMEEVEWNKSVLT
jgi:alpha-glucosidase (family GH31 glycosyl hydrolase)